MNLSAASGTPRLLPRSVDVRPCRLGLLLIVVVVMALARPANAATILATETRATTLSALDGRVVWSSFDPSARAYGLKESVDGRVRALPVRSQRVAFDVDLGTDRRGRTVAVYSRCRRPPPQVFVIDRPGSELPEYYRGKGCDVYQYDFATRRERRVRGVSTRGASEFLPTVWRGRIAFVRIYERRKGRAGVVSQLMIRQPGGGRTRRLRGGSGSDVHLDEPHPTALDLRRDRLAFTWTGVYREKCLAEEGTDALQTEVWVVNLRGGGRRLERTCAKDSPYSYFSPNLTADRLTYYAAYRRQPNSHVRQLDLRSGQLKDAITASEVLAIAQDADTLYLARTLAAGNIEISAADPPMPTRLECTRFRGHVESGRDGCI